MSPIDPGELAREITSQDRFQTTLPDETAPPELSWLDGLGSLAGSWVLMAAYLGLFVVILLLVHWALGERRRERAAGEGVESAGAGADPDPSTELRWPDPSALAAEGRHDAAIHVMLLRALATMVERQTVHVEDSLTSREILGRLPLEGRYRAGLRALVGAVETFHFGGSVAGPDDYDRCRAHYREATGEDPA